MFPVRKYHLFIQFIKASANLTQQRIGWRGLQSRPLKQFLTPKALYTVSARRRQEELTGAKFQDAYNAVNNPQTLTEKIVQRYSLGLPADKFVKSGDYGTYFSYARIS